MTRPARLVGINHVALEVGDAEAAAAFYGRLFTFEVRGRVPGIVFVDMGDQFLALAEGRTQAKDDGRHFGLVVDDVQAAREACEREGVEVAPGGQGGFDFYDPWGNLVQVVEYGDIQFERTPGVKRKLGIEDLEKSDRARDEIAKRGFA